MISKTKLLAAFVVFLIASAVHSYICNCDGDTLDIGLIGNKRLSRGLETIFELGPEAMLYAANQLVQELGKSKYGGSDELSATLGSLGCRPACSRSKAGCAQNPIMSSLDPLNCTQQLSCTQSQSTTAGCAQMSCLQLAECSESKNCTPVACKPSPFSPGTLTYNPINNSSLNITQITSLAPLALLVAPANTFTNFTGETQQGCWTKLPSSNNSFTVLYNFVPNQGLYAFDRIVIYTGTSIFREVVLRETSCSYFQIALATLFLEECNAYVIIYYYCIIGKGCFSGGFDEQKAQGYDVIAGWCPVTPQTNLTQPCYDRVREAIANTTAHGFKPDTATLVQFEVPQNGTCFLGYNNVTLANNTNARVFGVAYEATDESANPNSGSLYDASYISTDNPPFTLGNKLN